MKRKTMNRSQIANCRAQNAIHYQHPYAGSVAAYNVGGTALAIACAPITVCGLMEVCQVTTCASEVTCDECRQGLIHIMEAPDVKPA